MYLRQHATHTLQCARVPYIEMVLKAQEALAIGRFVELELFFGLFQIDYKYYYFLFVTTKMRMLIFL